MRTWRKVFSRMLFFLVVFSVSHGIPVVADASSNSASCEAQAADLKDDCTALEALYDATGGPSWTRKTNWKTTKPLNEWQGVWGDSSGVTSLRLNSNKLSGTIPDLSALEDLTILYLNHNYKLSGTLPDMGLSALTKLARLQLQSTKLSGTIPNLSALTSLVNLDLSATRLLSGTIPDLSKLVNLSKLRLNQNNLSGSIPDLDKLVSLTELRLSQNNLSGEIPDLDKLVNLTGLFLGWNSLDGAIPGLSKLEKLIQLSLEKNNLSGTIPELSALTKLKYIDLYENNLSGTIPDLDNVTELVSLNLFQNNLGGEIPDLDKLVKLKTLRLNNNNLSGTIPDLTGLDDMETIELDSNRLTGEIPSSLSDLTKLKRLFLGDNELSGEIPALSNLTELYELRLENNKLSGEIPELEDVVKLKNVHLQNNRLNGEIPELEDLTSLQNVYLQNNRLSGSLPDMSNLTQLSNLWFYNNRLGGTVDGKLPTSGNWLEYVYLHDNLMGSGSDLSPDLSGLPRLRELSLWGNTDPTGTVELHSTKTSSVIDRAALRFFYYANGGSGWTKRANWTWKYAPLGQWYGVTTNSEGRVTGINLGDNGLKNGITNSIEALSALTALRLLYNGNLGGTLPERLADISGLSYVDIRCTRVGTPLTHDFIAWVSRLGSGFQSGCGPPPSAPLQQEEEPEPEPELAEPEPEVLEEPEPGPEVVQEPEPELAFGGGVDSNWDCGGCAIVPAADTASARGNTAFNLLLVMVALLAVSRRGRFRSD